MACSQAAWGTFNGAYASSLHKRCPIALLPLRPQIRSRTLACRRLAGPSVNICRLHGRKTSIFMCSGKPHRTTRKTTVNASASDSSWLSRALGFLQDISLKHVVEVLGKVLWPVLLALAAFLGGAAPARAAVGRNGVPMHTVECTSSFMSQARETGYVIGEASTASAAASSAAATATAPASDVPAYKRSVVYDPALVPEDGSPQMQEFTSSWRVDKLKDMSYTQFWNLINERQIDTVEFSGDRRSVIVVTKPTAPGGVRKEKVGLPYDPTLFDHMISHGVYVKCKELSPFDTAGAALVRMSMPILFAWILIKASFRLGAAERRDSLFGGMKLERADTDKSIRTTFADIAGIDQVKNEIMEVVTFLRDPRRFLDMGARSPAGVLMVGPPGTGKTLLAKAIAGEAGVPFYSVSGTDFVDMYVGVGASRVRDMFQQARKAAPCILFIDEFDGLGKARSYSGMGDDESVHTINQLLTEMDGFDDNTGVVVMAATNRPSALDEALIRPGRFDRIVNLPLPNVQGRVDILKVHSRDKRLDPSVDLERVARACAGFTGAELMSLMNTSAIVSVRKGRMMITETDIFDALESIQEEKFDLSSKDTDKADDEEPVAPQLRKAIAVYEAGRAVIAYITPMADEIGKVTVCPGGQATGYTYFIPGEELLEARVVTRGYMEAKLVVGMAGRCAEKLVMGESNMSTAGASDIDQVNNIAREMVYRCGFSKRLGPVALMDNEEVYINRERRRAVADISTDLARIALEEVQGLIEGAEAKAHYGLVLNRKALELLYQRLLVKEVMSGEEVRALLDKAGVHKFPDPYVHKFGWSAGGNLMVDDIQEGVPELESALVMAGAVASNGVHPFSPHHPLNPYHTPMQLSADDMKELGLKKSDYELN